MPVKHYRPTTPGRRGASVVDTSHLDKKRPERSLISIIKQKAGRNNQGKLTIRHQGSGEKRYCRLIDFKRNKYDVLGTVIALEYDPNRSAHIALIQYPDGEKRYILAPVGLQKGNTIISSVATPSEIKPGNSFQIKNIPPGVFIHNIELQKGKGATIARAAGMSAILQVIENGRAQIKLPSGEIRLIQEECRATIGYVGNSDHRNIRLGKAGRKRHLGIRPSVTGKSMNPVDHPHGGGEGHQPIGLKHPKTPWGKPALGVKTRKRKSSDKFILHRRKK